MGGMVGALRFQFSMLMLVLTSLSLDCFEAGNRKTRSC